MSKQDPAEQVRFLVSCIGHTTNGRPDFSAVASELNIVSKAAAQKRYERMLKANGVSATRPTAKAAAAAGGIDADKTPVTTPVKKRGATRDAASRAAKKIKTPKSEDSDDDEVKKEEEDTKVKKKRSVKKEEDEEDEDSSLSDPPTSEETE